MTHDTYTFNEFVGSRREFGAYGIYALVGFLLMAIVGCGGQSQGDGQSQGCLIGCSNPDQVADDFIADREDIDTIVPVEGFCPEFSDASGTYMIAVLTPLDRSKPLLMQADVEMADIDASPTIKMVLTPLSVAERAPVGTPIETEAVPVNADGSFVLPFGNVAVTGEANPISGGDIEADLTLNGQIRQSDYICGDVVGDLLQPTSFNLEGTTAGLVRVDNADFEGINPSLACPECN